MTRHTHSRSPKEIAGATLAGLGIAVLLVSLDLATAQLSHLLGTVVQRVVPCMVPTALQLVQALLFDYVRTLQCPLQMLVSFGPLFATLASAA